MTEEQAEPTHIHHAPKTRSADLGELAGALAKAQGDMAPASKDKDNPFYKTSYAALASVWNACRPALSKNGLSVIQIPGGNGLVVQLDTILAHSSGQWIMSSFSVQLQKPDPQKMGSALTYMRRYALAAMVGITQSDDDGNEAAKGAGVPEQKSKAKQQDDTRTVLLERIKAHREALEWSHDDFGEWLFTSRKESQGFETPAECMKQCSIAALGRIAQAFDKVEVPK